MANEATVAEPGRGPSGSAITGGRTSWLLCRVGTRLCAIPLARVIEVMRQLPIEVVPGAPAFVRGLSVIRGAAVPVVDAGMLLGEAATEGGRLLTVRTGSRTAGLAVDLVLGVHAFADDMRSAMPPLMRDAAAETIAAIGILDAELLFFLRTTLSVPDELFDRAAMVGAHP